MPILPLALPKYVVGINWPWLEDRYGTDLSHNQFSGNQIWEYPYSKPVTYDFTRPDPNPPMPLLLEDPAILHTTFDRFEGIDVVRIWLFERLEGLVFDQNNNLVGIHPSMIESIRNLLGIAEARHFQIYFCLLNGWDAKWEVPDQFKTVKNRVEKYSEWASTVRGILTKIVVDPEHYCNNVLAPLINLVRNNSSVYAIDLMNEPEGLIYGLYSGMKGPLSESIVRNFLNKCGSYFKSAEVPCATGWMHWENAIRNSDLVSDFVDFHHYSITGMLLPCVPALFHNKRCTIGECGYPVIKNDEANMRAYGVQLAKSIIINAKTAGFAGAFAWRIEGTQMSEENETLLGWLKHFASTIT